MPTYYKQVLNAYADIDKFISSKSYTLKEIGYHINTRYGFGALFVQKRIDLLADRGDVYINKSNIVCPSSFRQEEEKTKNDPVLEIKDQEVIDISDIKKFVQLKPVVEENE